jgi:hypothetical protein
MLSEAKQTPYSRCGTKTYTLLRPNRDRILLGSFRAPHRDRARYPQAKKPQRFRPCRLRGTDNSQSRECYRIFDDFLVPCVVLLYCVNEPMG